MSKWGSFLQVLKQVGPVILASNEKTAGIAPIVVHAIAEAEAIKGSGAEKKAHAMAIVRDAVTIAHGAHVTGFEDPTLVLNTVSEGIDTTVGAVSIITGTKKAA